MKHRLIHTILSSAALLLLFGCQTDESVLAGRSKGINIQPTLQTHVSGTTTRTAPGVNAFSDGDIIGVSIAKGNNLPQAGDANCPYKYTAAVWGIMGEPFYWSDETSEHTLRAYYPYDKDAYAFAAISASFELPLNEAGDIDLTIEGAYAQADKAWGKITTTPTDELISIPMTHRMAQIVISLKAGEGVESVTGMTVELLAPDGGFAQVGNFNIMDGNVTAATDLQQTAPQKMQMLQATDGSFYALVMPGQTFKAGMPFARIKATDGKTYIYSLAMAMATTDLLTESNKPVHFNLTVAKGAVSGMGVTAEDWNDPTQIDPVRPAVREENGYLVIESTAGDLANLLTDAVATGTELKKLRISGEVNATDLGSKEGSNTATGLNAYINTKQIEELHLDAAIDGDLGGSIFKGCTTLQSAELSSISAAQETKIANIFDGCTGLKSVVMLNITKVAQAAFLGCTNLETVILPAVNTLSLNSFKDCNSLEQLVISSLQSMANVGIETHYPTSLFLTGVNNEADDLKQYASCANTGAGGNPATYTFPKIYVNYTGTATKDDYLNVNKYGRNYSDEPSTPDAVIEQEGWLVVNSTAGGLNALLGGDVAANTSLKKLHISGMINKEDWKSMVFYLASKSATDIWVDATGFEALDTETRFNNCTALVNAKLMNIKTIAAASYPFVNSTALKTVYMPELTTVAQASFNGRSALEVVVLPKASGMVAGAFTNCTSLKQLVLKDKGAIPPGATNALQGVPTATLSLYLVSPTGVTDGVTLGSNYGDWTINTTTYSFNTIYGTYTGAVDYDAYMNTSNYAYSWTR